MGGKISEGEGEITWCGNGGGGMTGEREACLLNQQVYYSSSGKVTQVFQAISQGKVKGL